MKKVYFTKKYKFLFKVNIKRNYIPANKLTESKLVIKANFYINIKK